MATPSLEQVTKVFANCVDSVSSLDLTVEEGEFVVLVGPSIPDLLIAATAELAGLTVLHCHKDFELIAAVTGPPAERLQAP